jgi:hypothetical protein
MSQTKLSMNVCVETDRKCPKNFSHCCRECPYKNSIEICNGDKDQGCGNWEIGDCVYERGEE